VATENASSQHRKLPKQQRSRQMVAKIVDATAGLLHTVDPEQISTNAIAERADVSKGSIYQYFANKDEIIAAAIEQIAAKQAPAIENMLRTVTLDQPESAMEASIDMLIDFTIANRRLIRYIAQRPDHGRGLDAASGLSATLLAMSTLHMSAFRDRYRHELSPRSLAWLFYNMAVATTTRYIESDDPIPLEELRSGLKFASAGLLVGGAV
jgi:AcrR family transcriptional regulator